MICNFLYIDYTMIKIYDESKKFSESVILNTSLYNKKVSY